jgi:protein O-GlcNAc transferase
MLGDMTPQQQLEVAMSYHREGRLAEAEAIYRQILSADANDADVLHLLGMIAKQTGRADDAIDLIGRAIVLDPEYAEAHFNLGIALVERGQFDRAISSYEKAIQLSPEYVEAQFNLGDVFLRLGRLDEAIASLKRAVQLKPDYAKAYNNLGNALTERGQYDDAIAAYRRAIELNPNFFEAHNNMGRPLKEMGRLDEALDAYRQAIRLKPDFAEAFSNLGVMLAVKGNFEGAIDACQRAVQLKADYPQAHFNLACSLLEDHRLVEAIVSFKRAIQLKPDYAEAHDSLGNALTKCGQPDVAIASFERAIRIRPDFAEAHSSLGKAFKEKGEIDRAIAHYRRAVSLSLQNAMLHSRLVYSMIFDGTYSSADLAAELREWDSRHAQPFKSLWGKYENDRSPDRRLRIGYVSPDFRDHVVGQNLLPLFREHDRSQVEIVCYANVRRVDGITQQFRRYADVWHSIVSLSDAQAGDLIRQDRIDILVDLTLHTGGNRLGVFARKPAPVQATFAGYPGSTGLEAIDYRLTDRYLDPLELSDQFYSERSLRLPDTFWCYDPVVAGLAVNALPAESQGHLTFGCFNNFSKVNEAVIRLWAQVLKAVDRSRLMILCAEGSHRQSLLDLLQREGVSSARVEFVGRGPRLQYLELYHRIDVGLDTFPYNGHTTSLDSFWMGVPVVTLVGQTVVGRAGLSQLTNLSLTELIAYTPQEYVDIAAGLARDLPWLAETRRILRSRMQASPLMDAPRFAHNIEAAYQKMWWNWCAISQ